MFGTRVRTRVAHMADENRLTARQVANAKPGKGRKAAMLSDGGNLFLQLTTGNDSRIRRTPARPRFTILDCPRTLTEQRHAVKDYYPSRPSIASLARNGIEARAMMPGNAAAALLHHDGRADRYPPIEISDV